MKVFGHPMSTCTRKVLCTLAEKGAEHEFVMVDIMKGAHKTPEHLARQPFGVVPALEDDGFSLYESRAIIRYLDAKLPGAPLTPGDLKARAEMEQWISVEFSYFTPKAMGVIYEALFNPLFGKATDEEKLGKAREAMGPVLEIVDRHLAGRDFFAGQFSLADICYAPYVEYLFAGKQGDLVTSHKSLAAWWGRVSERPSWRKATGKLPAASGRRDVVAAQVHADVGALDVGAAGHLGDVAVGLLVEPGEVVVLEAVEDLLLGVAEGGGRASAGGRGRGGEHQRAEVSVDLDGASLVGEGEGRGDRVAKLADVSGPVVALEAGDGGRRDALEGVRGAEVGEHVADQGRDVVEASAEGR
jgi:glutathione S-transferase